MPKVKISEYSATANSNTDVASINIDEGCAPSGINNAIRAVMGHLKDFQQGTYGDPFNGPHNGTVGATTPSTGAFTTLSATGVTTVQAGTAAAPAITTTGDTNTGIWFPAADTIAFTEGGVESMRIDASGNLGIGTTTPNAKLQISGAGSQILRVTETGAAVNAYVVASSSGVAFFGTSSNHSIAFTTNDIERARIDTSGNLSTVGSVTGVGLVSTVNGTQLTLQRTGPSAINTMSCGGSGELAMVNSSANAIVLYNTFAHFPSAPTTASAANAFIDNSSAGYANQLLRSTSSAKYKTDVEDLQTDFSKKIYDLRTVWYRSAADADRKDWSWYGLIAEEVAAIEPRLVHWTYADDQYEYVSADIEGSDQQRRALKSDAVKTPDGIQYDRIGVLLLKEMQSLKAIIDTQALTIQTLTARITALESA
jgi:hypothetical protein